MKIETDDLPPVAEHPGPQVNQPARSWEIAGWISAGAFVLLLLLRACAQR